MKGCYIGLLMDEKVQIGFTIAKLYILDHLLSAASMVLQMHASKSAKTLHHPLDSSKSVV
jgi:hypothetical protein